MVTDNVFNIEKIVVIFQNLRIILQKSAYTMQSIIYKYIVYAHHHCSTELDYQSWIKDVPWPQGSSNIIRKESVDKKNSNLMN